MGYTRDAASCYRSLKRFKRDRVNLKDSIDGHGVNMSQLSAFHSILELGQLRQRGQLEHWSKEVFSHKDT